MAAYEAELEKIRKEIASKNGTKTRKNKFGDQECVEKFY